jgi:amidophosphoribosyltransferase
MVIPVPDSGRTAAFGYADALGKPVVEGLIKNRYIWRTFIMPSQDLRETSVKLKLNPVKSLVKGKDVALIDDSIVRGTTMRRIVKLLKSAGAKSVHVRISCPPIISSCYMGVDFPTKGELMASHMSVDEIRNFIGADSLGYQSIEGLVDGIDLPKGELCLACLTGKYPLREQPDFTKLEVELGSRR